jgi:hypothetical protein
MEDKELTEQIKKIKSGYTSVLEDEDEENLSFLDELNKLIRLILGGESADIYTLLSTKELEKWKKAKIKRTFLRLFRSINIRGILYFILLATITGFLVHEALPFYAMDGIISEKTWLKAILTEISFIFLSGYRDEVLVQKIGVNILRGGIFCLMLFVITSEVTMSGAKDISKINNLQIRIERLEKQIERTEKDIQHYKEINWPRNMTESIRKREKLEDELQKLKERQEKEGASEELIDQLQYKINYTEDF